MNQEGTYQKSERDRQIMTARVSDSSRRAYSFHTWSRIFPGSYNFILWFLLGFVGSILLVFNFLLIDNEPWVMYLGLVCVAIFLIRWIIEFSRKLLSYGAYKNFSSDLGFKLEGWDQLGSLPNQLKFRHWSQNSTIEIILNESATKSQVTYLRDALYLFMSKANEKFYEAAPGRDGRIKWTCNNALKVAGSSDREVIGEMYVLIHDYLRSIQKRQPAISVVRIKFDPKIDEVEPPSSDHYA